jgi:hypothetical protein
MVDGFVKECVSFVTANTRPEDLLSVFTSCLVLDEPELQGWCADQIMKDTAAVLRSPDFLKLSPAAMDVLIRAPATSVAEIEFFKAVCPEIRDKLILFIIILFILFLLLFPVDFMGQRRGSPART